MEQTYLVDSQVAGEAATVRKQLEAIISKVNSSSFDIAELLWNVKKNGYYNGFTTFTEYVGTLAIKPRKAQYLTKIAQTMEEVGVTRAQYEPLGTAKLREITSLDASGIWKNPETLEEIPIKSFIVGFVEKGEEMGLEEIKNHVKTLKGLSGDPMCWIHLYMKQSVLDSTVRPALELAKKNIGSVGKDDEGISLDASDSKAVEIMAVEYLNDPANSYLSDGNA